MKNIIIITISIIIASCDSSDTDSQDTACSTGTTNELAGCWLYQKCYISSNVPGHSRRVGVALSEDGLVLDQFTYDYEVADCSSNRNGGTSYTNSGTYNTLAQFNNVNDLTVTEFHYTKASGVRKVTYFYFNSAQLCFPVDSFIADYNEFDVTKMNDDIAYNELNEQIELNNCFSRVDKR